MYETLANMCDLAFRRRHVVQRQDHVLLSRDDYAR